MTDRTVARGLFVGALSAVAVVVALSLRMETPQPVYVEEAAPMRTAVPPPEPVSRRSTQPWQAPSQPPPARSVRMVCGTGSSGRLVLEDFSIRVEAKNRDEASEAPGRPIADALVVVTEATGKRHVARTDADGSALFAGRCEEEGARFEVSAEGFATWRSSEEHVTLRGDQTVDLDPIVSIEGVVRELDGTPLPGAYLSAVDRGRDAPGRTLATSGADGAFRLADMPAFRGREIRISARGHVPKVRHVVAADGPFDIRLAPSGILRGTVVDADARPRAGATVIAGRVNSRSWSDDEIKVFYEATTDERGGFVLEGLPLGEWFLHASMSGLADSAESDGIVLDDAHRDATTALALRRPARVEVTVTDASGVIVRDAEIVCRSGAGARGARPDAGGRAAFDVGQPGSIVVATESPGFRPTETEVEIASGETKSITVRLETGAIVSGFVVDDLGRALPAAKVSVESRGRSAGKSSAVTCGADGSFRIAGLDDDRYLFVAEAARSSRVERVLAAPNEGMRVVLSRTGAVSFRLVTPGGGAHPALYRATFVRADDRARKAGGGPWTGGLVETELEPGRWRAVVQAHGFAAALREFDVRPGESSELGEIVFDDGVVVGGRVVDADGAPVVGAYVEARGDTAQGTAATDATGAFVISQVALGAVRLSVHFDGVDRATKVLDVGSGGARGVEVVLAK